MQVPKSTTPWPTQPFGDEPVEEWNPLSVIGGAGTYPLEDFRASVSDPNPAKHLKVVIPTNNGLNGYPPEHVIGSAFAIKALIEDADNARLSIDYSATDQGLEGDLSRQFWALSFAGAGPVERIESNGYIIYSRRIPVAGGTEILVIWCPRTAEGQELTFQQRYPPQPWGAYVLPGGGPNLVATWRLALANGYTWGPGPYTHFLAEGDELRIVPGVPQFYYRTDEALEQREGFHRLPISGAPNRVIAVALDVPVQIPLDGTKLPPTLQAGDKFTLTVQSVVTDMDGRRYIVADLD